MGSMAQLGTWDAVVDLGQGSKGTLSVICLFCFFSWWLEGLIMIDNYSGTCSICCVEVGLLGLPGKKSSCEYDNKKSVCEYNNRYDGQMTRISQYFSRCPSRTNSLSPCTGSSHSGLDETYPNSNSPMFPKTKFFLLQNNIQFGLDCLKSWDWSEKKIHTFWKFFFWSVSINLNWEY